MSTNGAETGPNERLAERLLSIGATLRNGAKPPASGLSEDDLSALAAGLVPFLLELLAPLKQRIGELEARGWVGIWDAERSYRPKQQCTYGGNLWHCEKACTDVRPGTSDDWKLMQQNKSRR